jgi:regulator of replication initiation timing
MTDETTKTKKHRLTQLVLSEVSLVDRPANPLAAVVLFKRDSSTTEETAMSDEIKKQLDQVTAEKAALATEITTLKTDLAKFNTEVATLTAERDELKKQLKPEDKPIELPQAAKDQIAKALAAADAAQTELAKMRDDQDTAIYVAKAADLKAVPQKPEEFGLVLKRISRNQATPADVIALETVLKASDTLIAKGLNESGNNHPDTGSSAAAKLDALANEISKSEKVTFPVAYAKALEKNPELYTQYLAERQ